MMESLRVFLPSNASMGVFPNNKPSDFTKESRKDEWYVDKYGDRIKTLQQHDREFKTFNGRRKQQQRKKKMRNDTSKNRRLLQVLHQLHNMRTNTDRYAAIQQSKNKFIKDFCLKIKTLRFKKLSPEQIQVINRYRRRLTRLIRSRTSLKQKRKTLAGQKGGFISEILGSLVIPAITNNKQ